MSGAPRELGRWEGVGGEREGRRTSVVSPEPAKDDEARSALLGLLATRGLTPPNLTCMLSHPARTPVPWRIKSPLHSVELHSVSVSFAGSNLQRGVGFVVYGGFCGVLLTCLEAEDGEDGPRRPGLKKIKKIKL